MLPVCGDFFVDCLVCEKDRNTGLKKVLNHQKRSNAHKPRGRTMQPIVAELDILRSVNRIPSSGRILGRRQLSN